MSVNAPRAQRSRLLQRQKPGISTRARCTRWVSRQASTGKVARGIQKINRGATGTAGAVLSRGRHGWILGSDEKIANDAMVQDPA